MEATPTVVFVCLHGAAKSILAAAYLERLADEHGANLHATAAGLDPDPEVSPTNQDFDGARDLIAARVPQLLEEWKIAEK